MWGAGRPGYPAEPPPSREIEAGVREWAGRGVEVVVNLMEDSEFPRRGPGLLEAVRRHDLALLRFPIADFSVPAETDAFRALVEDVRGRLARGQTVLAHCNAGLGRTAVFLGCLLRGCGYPGDPVAEIRRIYNPGAMENPLQEAFVRGFPAKAG